MNNSAMTLLAGAFIGTYLNNPKFRSQVESGIQSILGTGIDFMNNMGGDCNVPNHPVSDEQEE